MNAIKTSYESLPEMIPVPKEFIHHKGEIIIILEDDVKDTKKTSIADYFGCIPDFPERSFQGNYEDWET
jgi:hypothetical protein